MIRRLIILLLIVGCVFGQCILEDSIQSLRTSLYCIGDTISLEHQLIEFDVCYGEYENSIFKIADLRPVNIDSPIIK